MFVLCLVSFLLSPVRVLLSGYVVVVFLTVNANSSAADISRGTKIVSVALKKNLLYSLRLNSSLTKLFQVQNTSKHAGIDHIP